MRIDTTFVRMRSGDHPGDSKMSKRAPRFVEFKFLTNHHRHKRFLQNERMTDQQTLPQVFNFCPRTYL